MEGKKITVVTRDGWKYSGICEKLDFSPIGTLMWVNLETGKSQIKINASHVVSLTHFNEDKSNRQTDNQ